MEITPFMFLCSYMNILISSLFFLLLCSYRYIFRINKSKIRVDIGAYISNPFSVQLHVGVLLHELYPVKHSASCQPESDGQLYSQEFIQALQKIDLDTAISNDLDVENFNFQTNQLPISCFSLASTGARSRLGYSEFPFNGSDSPTILTERKPPSSQLPSQVLNLSPSRPEFVWRESDKSSPENTVGHSGENSTQQITTIPSNSHSFVPKINRKDAYTSNVSDTTKHVSGTIDLNRQPSSNVKDPSCEIVHVKPEPFYLNEQVTETNIRSPLNDVRPQNFSDAAVVSCTPQRVIKLDPSLLSTPDNRKLLINSAPTAWNLNSTEPGHPTSNVVCKVPDDMSTTSQHSRRKSVLKPLPVDGHRLCRSNSSDSLSSGSANSLLSLTSSSSSDSELDYGSGHSRRAFNSRLKSDQPSNLLSCSESNVTNSNCSSTKKCYHCRSEAEESWAMGTTSSASNSQRHPSRQSERYTRDVIALNVAKVSYTYEEIVSCSNDRFQEIRASNLNPEQLAVVLEVRKRATNRYAAERCRRLKTATRDDLCERLSSLRLERQVLSRQVTQARLRKQRASESLLSEQKRLLSFYNGPDGDLLNPSSWRFRFTPDGELVLLAAGL